MGNEGTGVVQLGEVAQEKEDTWVVRKKGKKGKSQGREGRKIWSGQGAKEPRETRFGGPACIGEGGVPMCT